MGRMVIPWSIVPIWVTALVYLVSGVLFSSYIGSHWHRTAKAIVSVMVVVGVFWIIFAMLLMSRSAQSAQMWSRLFLPAAFFAELAVVEAMIVLFDMGRSRYVTWLWWGGVAGTVAANWPGGGWQPQMHPIPDGFWIAIVHPNWMTIVVKTVIYGGGVLAILIMSGYSLAQRKRLWRQSLGYGVLILMSGLLFIHDTWWVQQHTTWYPTIWMSGLAFWAILWMELRRQVTDTRQRIATDGLTGAISRSYGEVYGNATLKENALGLIYLDLDGFKRINDLFGHRHGDRVLQETVRCIQGVCRAQDRVMRLGGDEFLILFPGVQESDEPFLKQRIQEALADHFLDLSESTESLSVNASLGWTYAYPGSNWDDAVAQADQAMYRQKAIHRKSLAGHLEEVSTSGVEHPSSLS